MAILRILITAWRQFNQDNCFNRAAGLAYTTLLSLVPLLAVCFSVLSAFPIYQSATQKIQRLIFAYITPDSAKIVQQYFLNFIAQTSKLSIIGVAGLVATAVLLVFSMEQAFNNIWRVKCNRRGVTAFLLYWAVITLIPIVLAALYSIGSYSAKLAEVAGTPYYILENVVSVILPYVATFVAFFLLYLSLPNCKVPVGSGALAAIITTILFELAHRAFTFYINNFVSYELIYGTLATIPIFLLWLYVSWVVILFGAVLSHVLSKLHCSST